MYNLAMLQRANIFRINCYMVNKYESLVTVWSTQMAVTNVSQKSTSSIIHMNTSVILYKYLAVVIAHNS